MLDEEPATGSTASPNWWLKPSLPVRQCLVRAELIRKESARIPLFVASGTPETELNTIVIPPWASILFYGGARLPHA